MVSHAGTGSALANLARGPLRPGRPAASPKFGEAGDDHQRELADELEARGLSTYRAPEDITVDDLLATREHGVRRLPHVPPFALR